MFKRIILSLLLSLCLYTPVKAEYTFNPLLDSKLDYYLPQTPWASDIDGFNYNLSNASKITANGTITANGGLTIKNAATSAGFLYLYEDSDNGGDWIKIIAPASLGANYTFTLPADDGTESQVLTTDGNGVLSWGSGAAPGGNVTNGGLVVDQIPYASSTTEIKGDTELTYNATLNLLTVDNLTVGNVLTIGEGKLADSTIVSDDIKDGTIALVDLNTAVYAKDLVTTAPITGGTDNILVGADGDVTLALTMSGDIVATAPVLINSTTAVNDILPGGDVDTTISLNMLGDVVATAPLLVNGTTSVDNVWPGGDVDTTFSINMLKDLVTTAPLTGGTDNILPGTDSDITIALDVGALTLKNQTKSVSIYNITASHDILLWKTPKAITITAVDMACTGGTDVVAVLQECNTTGQACVNSNTTFWQTLAGQGTSFTTFGDAAIDAGDWLALNVTAVNGTPSNWAATIKYDE